MGSVLKTGRFTRSSEPEGTLNPSRGPILPFAVGVTGISLLLFIYLAVVWRNFEGITAAIPAFKELFSDFILYYYPMGEAIFRTGLPVEGWLYSPFIALLMAIFPPFGPSLSFVLWGLLQALSVILYLLLFRQLVPAGLHLQLLFGALALFSYPLILNLLGGQVSVFMAAAILGVLAFDERGRRAGGAGLLAFAVSFKFFPVLFIAPFAARRDARFLFFAAAALGAVLFLIPGVVLGAGDTLRFYSALFGTFRDSAWITANPHSQFFPHLVLRLAGSAAHDARALFPLLHGISYAVAAANMGLIFLVQRARLRHADLWCFQIVFMTIPFVLKTSWPHDFVFLSFTQALMVRHLLEMKKASAKVGVTENPDQVRPRPRSNRTVTFALLLPSIVLSNIVFFNLCSDFTLYGFAGFLFWANLFLLTATYILLLPPALRRVR